MNAYAMIRPSIRFAIIVYFRRYLYHFLKSFHCNLYFLLRTLSVWREYEYIAKEIDAINWLKLLLSGFISDFYITETLQFSISLAKFMTLKQIIKYITAYARISVPNFVSIGSFMFKTRVFSLTDESWYDLEITWIGGMLIEWCVIFYRPLDVLIIFFFFF